MVNVIIQNNVHASTNPYRTVCGLALSKKVKPTADKLTCLICEAREEKRFSEIRAFIKSQLVEIEEGMPVEKGMWRVVGYVEGGLR